jgi:hypothetical protein
MAILKLFDEPDSKITNDEELVFDSASKFNDLPGCNKLSVWKSITLRFAFFFASLFCVVWFAWSLLGYVAWGLRYVFLRNKKNNRKSLNLTAASFCGCSIATLSPRMGLSFLSAYFCLFSKKSNIEGIHLDDLIARVKRLSA